MPWGPVSAPFSRLSPPSGFTPWYRKPTRGHWLGPLKPTQALKPIQASRFHHTAHLQPSPGLPALQQGAGPVWAEPAHLDPDRLRLRWAPPAVRLAHTWAPGRTCAWHPCAFGPRTASAASGEGRPRQAAPTSAGCWNRCPTLAPPRGGVWLCRTLLPLETWAASSVLSPQRQARALGAGAFPEPGPRTTRCALAARRAAGRGAALTRVPPSLTCLRLAGPLRPVVGAQSRSGPGPRPHRRQWRSQDRNQGPKTVRLSPAPPFKAPDPRGQLSWGLQEQPSPLAPSTPSPWLPWATPATLIQTNPGRGTRDAEPGCRAGGWGEPGSRFPRSPRPSLWVGSTPPSPGGLSGDLGDCRPSSVRARGRQSPLRPRPPQPCHGQQGPRGRQTAFINPPRHLALPPTATRKRAAGGRA